MNLESSTGGDTNMQEKLLILRNKHNYSIKFMAEYLDISSQQYRAKEKGEYAFDSDEMFKIAKLFNDRLDNIFLPRSNQIGDKEGVN